MAHLILMKSDFSKLGIRDEIVDAISDIGWDEPTPIQTEAIPFGINGRDLLAQAQTGTGKTGTYGSIILSKTPSKNAWPQALILTPTRELALQVSEELERLSKYSGHRTVTVYGGVSMLKQTQAMDKGVDIIVATPGRLCDHLKDDERLLDDVSIVVLDEADRMLDMGFRKDLEFILERTPADRQTMLFSATMSKDIRKLAMQHLDDPKEICVSKDELVLDLIEQKYMMVEKEQKMDLLKYVLAKEPMKTMVFCFTKYRVDKVVRKLKMSFKLAGIHGEYSQNRREETLRKFRDGEIQVLIASDIAARGLDIDGVDRIINFDMPPEAETYVHRIGRTGRAGKTGLALSFVMKEDRKLLKEIENLTLQPIERIDTPTDDEMQPVFKGIKELSHPVMAKKNSRKNDVPVKDKVFIVAEINIGKIDGQGKASISQLIRDNTTVPKKSIGNISVGERTSTLEVESKYYSKTEDGLSKCKVSGKSIKMWKVSEVEVPITETLEVPEDVVKQSEERKKGYRGDRSDGRRSNDNRGNGRRRDDRDRRDSGRPYRKYGNKDQRDDDHHKDRPRRESHDERNDRPRDGRSGNYRKNSDRPYRRDERSKDNGHRGDSRRGYSRGRESDNIGRRYNNSSKENAPGKGYPRREDRPRKRRY